MQERMGNVSREVGILKKKKKRLESKNIVTEIKDAFDVLIRRLDTADKRI